jgi:hypothetical protein
LVYRKVLGKKDDLAIGSSRAGCRRESPDSGGIVVVADREPAEGGQRVT